MMWSTTVQKATSFSRLMLQQRRYANKVLLTFGGANGMYYVNKNATQVDVPTLSGDFGILAQHVPTIAVLKPGLVKVIEENMKVKVFFVSSGSVSVLADSSVQVLAEEAWLLNDFDVEMCKKLVEKYTNEKNLKEGLESVKAEVALACAEAMYDAVLESEGKKL